ncbi:MAG: lysophospholipid acyltransferase family protein [Christensenellales bacterium]
MKITKKQILQNVESLEQKGDFHEHAKPVDYSKMKKVDGNYKYIHNNFFYRIGHCLIRCVLWLLRTPVAFFGMGLKVKGREKIKGINNAVAIVNHVHPLDCVAGMCALNKRHLYVTIGDFNNFDNPLGDLLRSWGTLPLTSNLDAQKNFWKAGSMLLKRKKTFVMFYPEASLWLYYEKVRPFMNGAFHMAVKNNVPIVPMFIYFKKTGKFDKDGIEKRKATIEILDPIYADPNATSKDNIVYLREASYNALKEKYRQVYGKEMVFPEIKKEEEKEVVLQ